MGDYTNLNSYAHMYTTQRGSAKNSFVFIVDYARRTCDNPIPFILKANWKTNDEWRMNNHESENAFHRAQCTTIDRPLHVQCYAIFGAGVSDCTKVFVEFVR